MAGEKVTFDSKNGKGPCPGAFFKHASSKKGLVVIQEWWGMNEQIQKQAENIGKEGDFVTIVPDLYRGNVATDNEQADHAMKNLDWKGAVLDIIGAVKFLKGKGCQKVGVTGFCMGGALSLAAAALVKEETAKLPEGEKVTIDAAAPFYGIPDSGLCDVTKITCPIQCHFGEKDALDGFSSPKDAKALEEKLTKAGVKVELHMYPQCGHAFTHQGGPLGTYNDDAAKLAMKRLYEFMNEKLQ